LCGIRTLSLNDAYRLTYIRTYCYAINY